MWRTDSLQKTLMLGKIEGGRRRGRQRMSWLVGISDSMDMSLSKLQELMMQGGLVCFSPWGRKELDTTERLNDWTEVNWSVSSRKCEAWTSQKMAVEASLKSEPSLSLPPFRKALLKLNPFWLWGNSVYGAEMMGRTEKWLFERRKQSQESDWGSRELKMRAFVGKPWGDERVWRIEAVPKNVKWKKFESQISHSGERAVICLYIYRSPFSLCVYMKT